MIAVLYSIIVTFVLIPLIFNNKAEAEEILMITSYGIPSEAFCPVGTYIGDNPSIFVPPLASTSGIVVTGGGWRVY